MNKTATKFVLALMALTFVGSQVQAQFTTTFAKNVNPGQQSGFYYALPQTMLQIDFVVEETECEQGPLSEFASSYFPNVEYIEYGATEHKLVEARMTRLATPDPNATFFVSFGNARGSAKAEFDILPNGIIRSVGCGNTLSEETVTTAEPSPSTGTPCVSDAPKSGFINLVSSGKSDAQLAREAANRIEDLRNAKYYLITGDNDMSSNPETFNAMYQRIEEMEQEYLSLFLGKRNTRTVVKTVYVIPSKEVTTQTVAKFSETEGFTSGTTGSGTPITVQTLPLNATASINAPSQTAIESLSYDNKLFYRVPELSNVKVSYQGKTLLEERIVVNQLGVLLMAPFTNSKLFFDTTTGQITNLKMQ